MSFLFVAGASSVPSYNRHSSYRRAVKKCILGLLNIGSQSPLRVTSVAQTFKQQVTVEKVKKAQAFNVHAVIPAS